jgi:hypothetical protein
MNTNIKFTRIPDEDVHNHPPVTSNTVRIFNGLSSDGFYIGQKPSASDYERFRKLADQFEPLANIHESERTDDEEYGYQALYELLYREFSSPWYQWQRGDLHQQEHALNEFAYAVNQVWNPEPKK